MKIPDDSEISEAYEIAWYIHRYSKDFNGNLSDAELLEKIVNEKGHVNPWQFTMRKVEMMQMSEEDMADLEEIFVYYDRF